MRWPLELAAGLGALVAALALSLPPSPTSPSPTSPSPTSPSPTSPSPASPSPGLSSYTASYDWRAKLDPATHRIQAQGTIEFVNTSRAELDSLYFHLYLNAFKNDRTLLLRSPFGAGRNAQRPTSYGVIDVKSMTVTELGGVDLWAGRARHSPGDPEDETDIQVPLPEPLPPGGRLTLAVSFEAELPSLLERTGYAGSFHFAGQWFPKLARLEPDGQFRHFAFHSQAEFYADFGRYDVTLDVPEGFVVGASGSRVSDEVEKGRRISRFHAEPVHDFAWTAWDRFVERTAEIDGVDVRFLYPGGHEASRARTEAAIRAGLPYFSRKFGAYPYPNLTVVHPPETAGPAGGMEYPTLITTGGAWYLPHSGVRALEAVTLHELAHQWFYGLLASNEARWPFLDEGLTSYAEMGALSNWLGAASAAELFGLRLSTTSLFRVISAARGAEEAIAKPAAAFSSFQNLGALVYARTAILLETLSRVFGRDRMDHALSEYARTFRFGHPAPEDLLTKVRSHAGERAADILEKGLFERGRINFVVRDLQNVPNRPLAGYFERSSGRERVVPEPGKTSGYRASATLYRHGTLMVPVDILLIAEDGTRTVQQWDGRGEYHVLNYSGPSPLTHVIVDPERKVLIEDRLLDNQVSTSQSSSARVSERLTYWAALALGGALP